MLASLFAFLTKTGGMGLFLLGIFDSSFLFLPLGNDLLMLGLTAHAPAKLAYFAAMACCGSMVGCFLVDWISRKGGEQGLTRLIPANRIAYVKRRVQTKAGWALALAALLPPPFPFTPFVAAAAALQVSRARIFPILICARFLRFAIIGILALSFGRALIKIAQSPAVQVPVICLVVISLVGSVVSVWRLIATSGKAKALQQSPTLV